MSDVRLRVTLWPTRADVLLTVALYGMEAYTGLTGQPTQFTGAILASVVMYVVLRLVQGGLLVMHAVMCGSWNSTRAAGMLVLLVTAAAAGSGFLLWDLAGPFAGVMFGVWLRGAAHSAGLRLRHVWAVEADSRPAEALPELDEEPDELVAYRMVRDKAAAEAAGPAFRPVDVHDIMVEGDRVGLF